MRLAGLLMIVGGVLIVRWVGTAHGWWGGVKLGSSLATGAAAGVQPTAAAATPSPATVL